MVSCNFSTSAHHLRDLISPICLMVCRDWLRDACCFTIERQANTDFTHSSEIIINIYSKSEAGDEEKKQTHLRIADYYMHDERVVHPPERPELHDLTPAIEAVHHYCMAGRYDQEGKSRGEAILRMALHALP